MNSLRKHRKVLLICVACLVLCSFVLVNVADAAVGNSVSHSKSTSSRGSSGSSGGGFFTGLLIGSLLSHPSLLGIIIVIVIILYFVMRKKGGGIDEGYYEEPYQESYQEAATRDTSYLRSAMADLRSRDPNFSEDMFMSRVNNMFIQLQEAWQAKDWKKVRPFESDELFNTHARQLQEFIDSKTTNVVDEIAVLRTEISDYHDNGATETLDVYMRVRLKDYIINDETGKVIEGDPKQEITMEYELAMSRRKGVVTRLAESTTVTTCPNCGANVSINASGECEYCNSVVSNGDFDWVLTRLDVLSQE
ncbi:MAG: Tim44-like domain-containing protein [Syntrophomonadaceae bacterium]